MKPMGTFLEFLLKWGPLAIHVGGAALMALGFNNSKTAALGNEVPAWAQTPLALVGFASHFIGFWVKHKGQAASAAALPPSLAVAGGSRKQLCDLLWQDAGVSATPKEIEAIKTLIAEGPKST